MKFEQGDPVIIYAPSFYREKRIGLVYKACRDHEYGIRVLMVDPNAPIKEVCVDTTKGDTIERVPETPGT